MTAYEELIKLNSQLLKIQTKANSLKPQAIRELRQMDYSLDKIALMLSVGKVNVLNVLKNKKKKFHRQGTKVYANERRANG